MRGGVIHEGYFNFYKDHDDKDYYDDFKDVLRHFRHLHDILIRINLKMLNYDGHYQIATSVGSEKPVNWVENIQSAGDLGYKL